MGARPSSYKKGGGGFLHNKDVKLTGLQIVVESDVRIKNGKRAGKTWSPISLMLELREDGASETISKKLLIGDADRGDYGEISADGYSIEDPKELGLRDSEAGVFVASLCASPNFPEDRFDDDLTVINLKPMLGTYMRTVQEVTDQSKRQQSVQGPQVGKDGKEYDRKSLLVGEVYSVEAVKGAKPKAKAVEAIDVQAGADEVIAALVEKAGGTLKRNQLSAKLQVSKSKYPQFNGEWKAVSDMVMSTDYAADANDRGIIAYNEKTQTFTSAS